MLAMPIPAPLDVFREIRANAVVFDRSLDAVFMFETIGSRLSMRENGASH